MSNGETAPTGGSAGLFERRPWGRGDLVALLVWTAAIAAFFWDAVSLRRALFYFDITEINYPYRAFFAEELRAGPVLALVPGALLRPAAFQREPGGLSASAQVSALSLAGDLAGVQPRHGALDLADRRGRPICWLRRHVGPAGALTGAAIFGASGYVWGHLIHTSMINALASVPFVIWGLESVVGIGSMARGRARRSGPGVPGFRRPPARRAADDRPGRPVRPLPRGHRARLAGAAARAGDGGRRWSGWVSCSRACSGCRPRSCSIARRGPAGLSWEELDLWIVESRAAADPGRPRSLWHPRATPTGWTAFTRTTR